MFTFLKTAAYRIFVFLFSIILLTIVIIPMSIVNSLQDTGRVVVLDGM